MLDMISRITRLHKRDEDFDEKLREILFELNYEIARLKEREVLK
jgi:predicted transcriptional regulator